jgi:hypothetical protein
MFDYNFLKNNFCDTTAPKGTIKTSPYKQDGYIIASNGRIGVRVKIEDVENVPDDIVIREDKNNGSEYIIANFLKKCDLPDTKYKFNFKSNLVYLETKQCSECKGTGKEDTECPCCDGDGTVYIYVNCPCCDDRWEAKIECHKCEGEGVVERMRENGEPCYSCDGTGNQFSMKVDRNRFIKHHLIDRLKTLNNVLMNTESNECVFTFTDESEKCLGHGIIMLTHY